MQTPHEKVTDNENEVAVPVPPTLDGMTPPDETLEAPEILPALEEPPFWRKKEWVIAIVLAVILMAGAGGYQYYSKTIAVKGAVIAIVNDEKIYASERDKRIGFIEQNATAQGQDISTPEARKLIVDEATNMLINDALLLTAARGAGYTASNDDIQKEVDLLITGAGSAEDFKLQLAQYNLTEEELKINIANRIMTDAYLKDKTTYEEVSVAQEEIDTFYAAVKEQNKDIPPLADVKAQIEGRLLQQKQQQIIIDHLTQLREAAKIEMKEV